MILVVVVVIVVINFRFVFLVLVLAVVMLVLLLVLLRELVQLALLALQRTGRFAIAGCHSRRRRWRQAFCRRHCDAARMRHELAEVVRRLWMHLATRRRPAIDAVRADSTFSHRRDWVGVVDLKFDQNITLIIY